MLTGLGIRNFKSIGDEPVKLELKPLTILVGPNGGGKSTILEALALMAQNAWSTESEGKRGDFAWIGPWVQFNPPDLACHRRLVTTPLALSVELEESEPSVRAAVKALNAALSKEPEAHAHAAAKGFFRRGSRRLTYEAAFSQSSQLFGHSFKIDGQAIMESKGDKATLPAYGGAQVQLGNPLRATPLALLDYASELRGLSGAWITALRAFATPVHFALANRVFYLSAERGGDWVGVGSNAGAGRPGNLGVGKHGEFTIGHLAAAFGPDGDFDSQQRVRKWADRFGMKSAVAGLKREGTIGFSFDDPDLAVKLDYRSAGFGSRQLLPVIALLFASPSDSTLMIEEPEISLHPAGQVAVVEMIADAVSSGRQVFMSTHSKLVIMALRHAVANKLLNPQDVAIYEVTKTAAGTRADRLEFTPNGTVKGWIPSYAKIEDQLWEESFKLDDQAASKPA